MAAVAAGAQTGCAAAGRATRADTTATAAIVHEMAFTIRPPFGATAGLAQSARNNDYGKRLAAAESNRQAVILRPMNSRQVRKIDARRRSSLLPRSR